MIFLTGDIHGGIDIEKLSNKNWKLSKNLSRDDYLIILGDFGLPFLNSDFSKDRLFNPGLLSAGESYLYWIKWLSEKPYTVLWIDGNHDNHPYWYFQESSMWHGGEVHIHPMASNVIHLKRGEYYEIDGYTFWTMGGAESHDKIYRTPGISWWQEEIPDYYEMNHGWDTLDKHQNQVDFILTHTMPDSLIHPVLNENFQSEPTRRYFDEIYKGNEFKYWFCGHFHQNIKNDEYKIQVLYDEIVNLESYI